MHRTFHISEVRVENERTKTFVFDAALPARPGQFVMAWLPDVGEKPFSIAGADPLALTVVAVGPFSRALHELEPGERLWVRGPLGQGFRITGERLLLAGGGYGVAPLLFLTRKAVSQGCQVEVCIGARTAHDVLLVSDFEQLGVTVRVTTEDGSLGERGLVTHAVERAMGAEHPDLLCACGPVPMLEALDRLCAVHTLPRQLSWEALMRCGMGLCGSCELQVPGYPSGWLACQDGPVSFSR
jgi:dihydroorotate dehydrogenase electron transfer subunit